MYLNRVFLKGNLNVLAEVSLISASNLLARAATPLAEVLSLVP